MKPLQILLTITFCYCFLNTSAQEQNNESDEPITVERKLNDKKNEIKLGVIKALAFPIIDFEYERILNSSSSFGANAVVNASDENDLYKFSFSPFYKMYFTKSQEYGTKGFFAQGFLNYFNGEDSFYNYMDGSIKDQDYNGLALGFGVGQKWVNQAGFVFQISAGVGRNLINNDDDYVPEAIFQGDLFVGYKF